MDLVALLQPWNLIFLLPAVAAVLYLLLLAAGVVADGGEADFDADADPDLDLEADHGPADLVGGEAAGVGQDGQQGGSVVGLLSLVGVGRMPLSLILISFGLLWGFLGWVGNLVFGGLLGSPALFVWPSLVLALVGGALLTRLLANGLHRVLPSTESYGAGAREFVGQIADVRLEVGERGGTAQLHDRYGTLQEVPVRVAPGEAPIPAGERVILWRFDEAEAAYLALRDEAIDGPDPPRRLVRGQGAGITERGVRTASETKE